MCGYDPFYWYDRMLDQEYEEEYLQADNKETKKDGNDNDNN